MKKIVSTLLILSTCITLASCGTDEITSSVYTSSYVSLKPSNVPQAVNVAEYALKGEIYDLPYKLGDNPDTITEAYKDITKSYVESAPASESTVSTEEDSSESVASSDTTNVAAVPENSFEISNTDDGINILTYSTIQGENVSYCYKEEDESLGISFIGYMGNAYNFSSNITVQDDIIASCGQPIAIAPVTDEDIFYMKIKPKGLEKMTYNYDHYQVDFIILNKKLISTNIKDVNVW